MAENKVTYGLKNAHYAKITVGEDGGITYGTPKALPGSVEIALDPRGDMTEFYADDILYYSASNNQGYDGTLTIANIPEDFAIDILGEEKDETDLVITEKANATGSPFALMFEFTGDVKAVRHVMYNCTASRPSVGSSTKTDSVEPNTNELTFVASARPSDYAVKTKTTIKTPAEIYNNWYNKVYEKITEALTVTVSPVDDASNIIVDSNIVWTFNKTLNVADAIKSNFLIIGTNGEEVAGELAIDDTKKIVTFNPTSNLANSATYIATALKTIRGADGSTLAANNITNFTTVA